jgi:hypothetical protein
VVKENVVYLHNEVLFSYKKKNEIMSFVGKWIELEIILLGKQARLRRTNTTCFLSFVQSRKEDENRRGMIREEEGDQCMGWHGVKRVMGNENYQSILYACIKISQ